MSEQLVLIAIGLVVAAFVLGPLLRGTRKRAAKPFTSPAAGATSDQLAELELDRAMGRVSETDYTRWRAELARSTPVAAAEAENAAPEDARRRAEALVRQWKDAPRPTCSTCGVRPEPGARFCSNCGAALAP
ncbi:MAG TPA: c-type cytochrome biogenesis protein CcmI [Gemmatimonadaceae bacterium]|nr:c-type cytochrome biogenesis protein CcmI [Gemmatimonadaceae bacterium]